MIIQAGIQAYKRAAVILDNRVNRAAVILDNRAAFE